VAEALGWWLGYEPELDRATYLALMGPADSVPCDAALAMVLRLAFRDLAAVESVEFFLECLVLSVGLPWMRLVS
jgi:hypothetical protein